MPAQLADRSRLAAQGRAAWRTWLLLLVMLVADAVVVVVARRHYS